MKSEPLVMCVTNTVAANFTANVLLAIGAKPAMMEDPSEAAELAKMADGVLINVGTVHPRQAETMRAAIAACNEAKVPWVLDPVAAHLLSYRKGLVEEFIRLRPAIIRGNRQEIDNLNTDDIVTLATDETDTIRFGDNEMKVTGGAKMMQAVTATGCAQGAVCAAMLGRGMEAIVAAETTSRLMKRAAELAVEKAKEPGSFQIELLNALWRLSHD